MEHVNTPSRDENNQWHWNCSCGETGGPFEFRGDAGRAWQAHVDSAGLGG